MNLKEQAIEKVGKLGVKLLRWSAKHNDSNLVSYAERELDLVYPTNKSDFYGGLTAKSAMDLVSLFSLQGHSGMSASVVNSIVTRLYQYLPLTPLTGKDNEWTLVDGNTLTHQNKRCAHVFKSRLGNSHLPTADETLYAYDSEFFVFDEGKEGGMFSSYDCRKVITFPYYPMIPIPIKVPVNSTVADRIDATLEWHRKGAK